MNDLLIGGYCLIAILVLLFFVCVVRMNRQIDEREARIESEEQRIREDSRYMREWYNSRRINVEGETEAEIAAMSMNMAARG